MSECLLALQWYCRDFCGMVVFRLLSAARIHNRWRDIYLDWAAKAWRWDDAQSGQSVLGLPSRFAVYRWHVAHWRAQP